MMQLGRQKSLEAMPDDKGMHPPQPLVGSSDYADNGSRHGIRGQTESNRVHGSGRCKTKFVGDLEVKLPPA